MKRNSIALLLAAFVAPVALAQDENLSWSVTEVEPGIYMFEGQGGFTGGNLGLSMGDDGVVLIDDGLPNLSAMTIASVEEVTGRPVNFLINTHAHGDHTGANADLHTKGATVVAHDNLRAALLEDEAFPAAGLPELTFNDSMTFHLNGHTALVFHLPAAHTSGDSAILFTDVNVLHTGDVMFNKIFPFIDLDGGGSVDGFIAAQQRMLSMIDDDTKVIPGHGPLASKADLQSAVDMLIDARSKVRALVEDGKSLDEVKAANPLAQYESWSWDFITTERMTETLHRSLTSN
jgi:glyoxylase-like metal-dependent hydrolase (beta-lactamase superfamily II)